MTLAALRRTARHAQPSLPTITRATSGWSAATARERPHQERVVLAWLDRADGQDIAVATGGQADRVAGSVGRASSVREVRRSSGTPWCTARTRSGSTPNSAITSSATNCDGRVHPRPLGHSPPDQGGIGEGRRVAELREKPDDVRSWTVTTRAGHRWVGPRSWCRGRRRPGRRTTRAAAGTEIGTMRRGAVGPASAAGRSITPAGTSASMPTATPPTHGEAPTHRGRRGRPDHRGPRRRRRPLRWAVRATASHRTRPTAGRAADPLVAPARWARRRALHIGAAPRVQHGNCGSTAGGCVTGGRALRDAGSLRRRPVALLGDRRAVRRGRSRPAAPGHGPGGAATARSPPSSTWATTPSPRAAHLAGHRHGHVHPGRCDQSGDRLGTRRRHLDGDGVARPSRRVTWFNLGDRGPGAPTCTGPSACPRAPPSVR